VNGYSQVQRYRTIAMAPIGLRDRLLEHIESECHRKRQGQPAHIMAKMNSLADPRIIDALYAASQAGVKVELVVRGICCLRPGVPGLSDNISVISIVDRFLEHSRIFYFHHGGQERVLISSADCMPRNLDKRLELLVPVDDPPSRARLIRILETCLEDEVKGRRILPDGGYQRPAPAANRQDGSQAILYKAARKAARESQELKRVVFEPHRAPDGG
jgi:polyphosphate kinase